MSNGSPSSSQQSRSPSSVKPTFHFAAGLLSGLSSSILLQPADLLKTRVQQSRRTTSLLSTIRTIIASPNPVRGLWRGTLPSALRTGIGSALYFSSLNTFRQSIANRGPSFLLLSPSNGGGGGTNGRGEDAARRTSALPQLSHSANLLTGAVARVAAGFVMMPVTVLKVRYESDYYAYRSLWGAGRDIVRHEGFRGLFAGFGATAIRDGPYAGIYVVFYEHSKRTLSVLLGPAVVDGETTQSSSSSSSASINFLSGAMAAGLATTVTNPFDVVKTRVQLMPVKYRNMLRATKLMLREDGMRSLFDGLALRMGRKALSSALAWTVYEELIMRAERKWAEDLEATLVV